MASKSRPPNSERSTAAKSGFPALHSLFLFALGLLSYGLAARWVATPGYMDADYYLATGLQLHSGEGWVEPFLWNYLDDPAGIPHPSHLYWMPMPSAVAALGLWLAGTSFRAAQVPFILIAAALPPLAAQLSWHLTAERAKAWVAGGLAAFPGFFLPFFVTTDAFGLYAILGGFCLWTLATATERPSLGRWLLAGILTGLANLTRADAPLLLLIGFALVAWMGQRRLAAAAGLVLGYLLVIGPWWARNLVEVGSIVNPGSSRLLWLLDYDDLFSYPANLLTFERWKLAGLGSALAARWQALGTNLQRLLAENGLIFLAPLVAIGAYRLRRRAYIRVNAVYLAALLLAMTVIFPFVGSRGGLFHSGAALMPAVWALAPIGLGSAIHWLGRRRRWNLPEAERVFGVASVVLAAMLTFGLFYVRQIRPAARNQGWTAASETYADVAARLPEGDLRVAVNNPPGFYLETGRPAIVIPDGDHQVLLEVMDRYRASWLVLEANHPAELADLYRNPANSLDFQLYRTLTDRYGRYVYILRSVHD